MHQFQYLNYQDIKKRLDDLVLADNPNKIIKEKPLGYSEYGLPIDHYKIGNGPKHIIVSGSYHAAEIITSIFVIRLMEEMSQNPSFNQNEYTIDFIPIVNPEGYLITTEMQDLYLGKDTSEEEKIARAKVYWAKYRADAGIPAKVKKGELEESALRGKKTYQALFDDVNLKKYLRDYPELKQNVLSIINQNNYPIGVLAAWTVNGSGIDLSQNVPFNPAISTLASSKEPVYNHLAYANTRKDIPGPINTPCRDFNHFYFESENLAMLNFLENLSHEPGQEIIAYFNYHSVMGKMYQRPVKEEGMLNLYGIDYEKKVVENYISSKIFRGKNAYDIIESEDPYGYINEFFRLRYGINIQVELSRMGSNPIGPLADPDTFENITVKPNLEAFKNFVKNYDFIKNYATFIKELVDRIRKEHPEFDILNIYDLIDRIGRENPTLYTKLQEEFRNKDNHNAHVISYFYQLLQEKLKNSEKENEEVKRLDLDSKFNQNFHIFLMKIIEELNEKRKEPMSGIEIENLINNLFRDYPELIAKVKYQFQHELPVQDLYQELSNIIHNQIKMGNLMNLPKRPKINPLDFPEVDLLVNKENPLPENYIPTNIIDVRNPYYKSFFPGVNLQVNKETNMAFQLLKEEALKEGYELWIDSGYRTRSYQEKVLNHYLETIGEEAYQKVALPGTSEHESGYAIDLGTVIDGKYFDELTDALPVTKWLHENCHKYGFIIRYPKDKEEITGFKYEPWHLRYVGLELAKYLHETGLTLEEYHRDKSLKK